MKSMPAVGQIVYRVVETGDGIEVMQRSIVRVTPKHFVLDRPFPFGASIGPSIGIAAFGVSYHLTSEAALRDYRGRAALERDHAKARVVSQEARVAWADKQLAKGNK